MKKIDFNFDAVMIGAPESIFPEKMSLFWQSKGIKTAIITRGRTAEYLDKNYTPKGVRIIFSEDYESEEFLNFLTKIEKYLKIFEKYYLVIAKIFKREGNKKQVKEYTSFVSIVINALSISKLIKKIKPRFIFGQEVFTYGLSVALCRKTPKAVMPWGGDIYMYAHATFISKMIVKYSLNSADFVFPGSVSSVDYLVKAFKVKRDKIIPLFWGVNREEFPDYSANDKINIRSKYGIKKDEILVISIRRFLPLWGCFEILDAFIDLANDHPGAHFIILGGKGTEKYTQIAKRRIAKNNLEKQITVFEGEVDYEIFINLIMISDIFVSLMHMSDMRSSSVMQATYACGVGVVTDNKEYRLIGKNGFKAIYVDPKNKKEVIHGIERFILDEDLRREYKAKNREYIVKYEDFNKQMMKILTNINRIS